MPSRISTKDFACLQPIDFDWPDASFTMSLSKSSSSSKLPDILTLSDDEGPTTGTPASADQKLSQVSSSKRGGTLKLWTNKRKRDLAPVKARLREKVLRRLYTKCQCAVAGKRDSCFCPFRNDEPATQEIVRLRERLFELHKQDADEEVP